MQVVLAIGALRIGGYDSPEWLAQRGNQIRQLVAGPVPILDRAQLLHQEALGGIPVSLDEAEVVNQAAFSQRLSVADPKAINILTLNEQPNPHLRGSRILEDLDIGNWYEALTALSRLPPESMADNHLHHQLLDVVGGARSGATEA